MSAGSVRAAAGCTHIARVGCWAGSGQRGAQASISVADLEKLDGDFGKTNPRFTGENFQRNPRIADEVRAVADEAGTTLAQVALAWVLGKGDDVVPIPRTKRVSGVEENTDGVELTPAQIANPRPAHPGRGGHHPDAQIQRSNAGDT
jgi:aryl-alcohol dehydrogenase-like predicted oxidoreductase